MKKNFVLLLFTLLISQQSYSQFKFGTKAGVNLSNIDQQDLDSNPLVGFHAGVIAEIPWGKRLYFATEILYSLQGYREERKNINEEKIDDIITEFGYLQAPFILKYRIIEGLNIQAGPQLGLLVSAITREETQKQDNKYLYLDFEYGAIFGLGYKFYPGLFVQARYNLGFGEIYDKEKVENLGIGQTANNRVIQFSVGYMF